MRAWAHASALAGPESTAAVLDIPLDPVSNQRRGTISYRALFAPIKTLGVLMDAGLA